MRLFIDYPDDEVTDASLLAQNVRDALSHAPGYLAPSNVQLAPTGDAALEDAKRVLRADYWQAVRSMAEDAESEVKNGNLDDEDALTEYVEESLDGSYWLTYNHAILQVLCWTEHDDAYEEVGIELDASDPFKLYTQIAYWAMRADVQSYVADWDDLMEAKLIKAGDTCPVCELDDLIEDEADKTLLVCPNCHLEARTTDTAAEARGRA